MMPETANARCSNCGSALHVTNIATREPTSEDWWLCLWCDQQVCIDCWHSHTQKKHHKLVKPTK